jgi:hypothetical protein
MFAFNKMKQLEFNVQQVIIEKFLVHPLMQNMFPNYLTNLQCLKAHEEVMSNLKCRITYHLTTNKRHKLWLPRILFVCWHQVGQQTTIRVLQRCWV